MGFTLCKAQKEAAHACAALLRRALVPLGWAGGWEGHLGDLKDAGGFS